MTDREVNYAKLYVLNENDLKKHEEKIKALGETRHDTSSQKIFDYYHYTNENKHIYGSLAAQAPAANSFEALLAENYIKNFAKRYQVEFTPTLRRKLMVELALAGVNARLKSHGHVILPEKITEYQKDIFNRVAGLPNEAWIGTVFEEYGGTGFWLFGQGPADQNGGQFTVDNLNRLMQLGGETGTRCA